MSPSFSLTTEQISAAIADHDLRTYEGWMATALALLADAPDWTAIQQEGGFVVKTTYNGKPYICACAEYEKADATYTEEDLYDFDRSAWWPDAWDGMDAVTNVATLTNPVFVKLRLR